MTLQGYFDICSENDAAAQMELEEELDFIICSAFTAYNLDCGELDLVLEWRTATLSRA
mgnify:CR=1 FL=1